jgi:hypothetical protein
MVSTTVLARNGGSLSYDVQIDGWFAFINAGGYTDEQQDALTNALMEAQRERFNSLLPDGCTWFPSTSEIIGPVDADVEAALETVAPGRHSDPVDDVMAMVCEEIADRIEEIEQQVLRR